MLTQLRGRTARTATALALVALAAVSAKAAFHQLTIVKTGSGSGTVRSQVAGIFSNTSSAAAFASYSAGSVVNLAATPAAGAYFRNWSSAAPACNSQTTSQALACGLTMDAAKTVFAAFTTAPPAVRTWAKTVGGIDSFDELTRAFQTVDGGYFAAGTMTIAGSEGDIWVMKLSADGTLLWDRVISFNGSQRLNDAQPTADGGYILAGQTAVGTNPSTGWVVKLDGSGDVVWSISDFSEGLNVIRQTADGGYVAGGSSNGNAWITKLTDTGLVEWQSLYTSSSEVLALQQTGDGGFIAAGTLGDDAWLLKLATDGSTTWQRSFGNSDASDSFAAVEQTADGGYIVAGQSRSFGVGVTAAWVVKTSANGVISWQNVYNSITSTRSAAAAIQQTVDGGYLIAGKYNANLATEDPDDAWLMHLLSNGAIDWQKTYGSSGAETAYSARQTVDGGYIVSGFTDFLDGLSDALLLKVDTAGNVEVCQPWLRVTALDTSAITPSTSDPLGNGGVAPQVFENLPVTNMGTAVIAPSGAITTDVCGPTYPLMTVKPSSENIATFTGPAGAATRNFTISNSGTEDLTLDSIAFTPASGFGTGDSGNLAYGSCLFGVPMVPGAACTFSLSYNFTNSGVKTANISIVSDDRLNPVTDIPVIVTVYQPVQTTLTVTGMPTTPQPFAATFTVGSSGGSGSGSVSFSANGACTVDAFSGQVTMISGSGSCAVTATKLPDSTFSIEISAPASVAAALADQATLTVTGMPPAAQPFGAAFTVGSSGGSGSGAVSFAAVGACSVNAISGQVVMTGSSGSCTITASKAADSNYSITTSAPVSVAATLAGQTPLTVTGMPAAAQPFGATFTVGSSGGSGGGAVSFTANGACTVNTVSGQVNMTSGSGSCTITAVKAADSNFRSETSAPVSVAAAGAIQSVVTLTAPSPVTYLQSGLFAIASGGSGSGAYSYSAGDSTACSVDALSGALTIISGTGTCMLTASRAADANYAPSAASAPVSVVINKSAATVILGNLIQTYTAGQLTPTAATSPPGLAIIWTGAPRTAAGSYSVTATINDPDYQGSASGTFTIDKMTVVPAITAASKTYDGTTAATIVTRTLSGVLPADANNIVLSGGTAVFDDARVAPAKKVSATGLFLSGSAAANYSLTSTQATTTADIVGAPLTITGMTAVGKTYDGTTGVTLSGGTLVGIKGADQVSIDTRSGAFASKNAGTARQVIVQSITLTGFDADNYTVTNPTGITATIEPASLVVTANSTSKTYGQAVVFTGTEFTATGLQNGETIAGVTLTSAGAAPAASVAASPYSITPAAATGGTFTAANYAITYLPGTLTINKADQAPVTVTVPSSALFGQTGLFATAAGGSGTGAFSYSSGSSTACSVNAVTGGLTISSGIGSCSITAAREADTNFTTATASAPAAIAVSSTPPTVAITGRPANPTGQQSATFSFRSPSDSEATFLCSFDGGSSYVTCSSPLNLTDLAAGNHTFAVKAVNPFGVESLTADSYGWLIDLAAPTDGTLAATPGNGQVILTWSGFADNDSGIASFRMVMATGTPPADCSTGIEVTSPYTLSGLTNDVSYGFRVCAVDSVGNMSAGVTAVAVPRKSFITMSPAAHIYDIQVLGTPSAAVNFVIANTGSVATGIDTLGMTGPDRTDFSLSASGSGSCPAAPFTLAAGTSCTVAAVYMPLAGSGSSRSALISATTTEPESPLVSAPLSGAVRADGILAPNNSTGIPTIADAVILLHISIGDIVPTGDQLLHGDVAPLVNGVPVPNGVIDVGDALVLLRRIVGLVSWGTGQ